MFRELFSTNSHGRIWSLTSQSYSSHQSYSINFKEKIDILDTRMLLSLNGLDDLSQNDADNGFNSLTRTKILKQVREAYIIK
jgi:hypothetical protein